MRWPLIRFGGCVDLAPRDPNCATVVRPIVTHNVERTCEMQEIITLLDASDAAKNENKTGYRVMTEEASPTLRG